MTAPRSLLLLAMSTIAAPGCGQGDPLQLVAREPCRQVEGFKDDGNRYVVVEVPSAALDLPVEMELVFPLGPPLLDEGAPVMVVVHGGWRLSPIPTLPEDHPLLPRSGWVQVFLSLPGSGAPNGGESGDWRGELSRRAVAAAMDYAAGGIPDADGCFLAERAGIPLADLPLTALGRSNGGNLLMATLADPDLTLPTIGSVLAFEVPAAPHFLNLELGSHDHPLSTYRPGDCAFTGSEGITCALPDQLLELDWIEVRGMEGPGLFWDLDGDGSWSGGEDVPIWGTRPTVDGAEQIYYSPRLLELARELGIQISGLADADDAAAFWAWRDASRLARAAVEAWPDLPFMLLGTTQDHAQPLEDHPHVIGLADALEDAGAPWIRVNADAAYMELMVGGSGFVDNPARGGGAGSEEMEIDEDELGVDIRCHITAAATELAHRQVEGRWDLDLDAPLRALPDAISGRDESCVIE